MNTDTPRTDAWKKANRCDNWPEAGTSPFTLCRQLEQELTALEKSIADLTHPNIAELLTRLHARENDLRLAAGELKVPMPEPGTDLARSMSANAILRHHRKILRDSLSALLQILDDECIENRVIDQAIATLKETTP